MKKNLKKIYIAFILTILISIYVYMCAIVAIPDNTILFEGEILNLKSLYGITFKTDNEKYESVLTSSKLDEQSNLLGTTKVKVQLFNTITVKEVSVNVLQRTKVIPIGQVAGLKLYTSGVLVVGMSEIKGTDNKNYKPYEKTGIKEGDMIIEVGDKNISNTNELLDIVNSSKGKKLRIVYIREGKSHECSIKPIRTTQTEYKLGLWVRDSAAGIGTITFYEQSTGMFAALGHGISDIDTGDLINISKGEFVTTKVISVAKGKKGSPGKIQGTIDNSTNIGQIYKNTNMGIYGKVNNLAALNLKESKQMDVATRNEIQLGRAEILCSLDNKKISKYKIEIERIFINNNYDNKSMLVKIVDEELIKETGGIIQGMSGSPIIQNGKFIGCITNVLVNDPTKGYGVFGDLMIKEMKSE